MSDISKIKVGSTSYDIKDADARSRIAALEAIADVYGAKNLLPTGESGTYSGLTFTVNADGSITISGTASGNVYYTVACPKLYAGDYILTGYPSSAIGMNCSLYYDEMPGSDTGDGQPFTLSQYVDNKNVYIFVLGGTNFTTPVTFYPMIRDARITDPTYVPYAMTNKELTDAVNRGSVSVTADGVKTYKELLNQLFLSIDRSKLSIYTVLQVGHTYCNFLLNNYMGVFYTAVDFNGVGAVVLYRYRLHNSDSSFAMNENGTYSDLSATVPASGTVFTVYY